MGKNLKRFALVLCVLALCVSTMAVTAFAAEDVRAEIPVSVSLKGTLPAADETFVVEMTPDDAANPMPEGTENGVYRLNLVGQTGGKITIPFTALGVYDYTVKQVPGSNENCVYDGSVYHVTVFVTNEEQGGYCVAVVVYRNEETEKRDDIVFDNVYANPDEITITAIKTMDGKTPADGAFTFQLLDSNGKVVSEVKNKGRDITFPALSFYKVGTYEYQIKEVAGTDTKIDYDETVYDVKIQVTKDGDYKAVLTYSVAGKAYEKAPVFANKTITVTDNTPKTGDEFNMMFYIGLMGVSAAVLVVLLVAKKKSAKKQ